MNHLKNSQGFLLITIQLIFMMVATTSTSQGQNEDAESFFKDAELLYRNFDYEEAIPIYDKAIDLDPKEPKYYLQRGFCKNITQDFEGAIRDFSAVINLTQDNSYTYVSRGSAKNKSGDFASALEDFNKALEINPKDQEAYNNRGFSKKKLGDKKGACEDWYRSKKLGNNEAKIIIKNNYCK